MKKYKIFIKLSNKKISNLKEQEECILCNYEITEIIDLLISHVGSYVRVLEQALKKKDQVLINSLIDALIEGKVLKNKKEIQKIISDNDYEIIILITSYGYIDILNKLLEIIPYKQKSKTFILKLITIAAVNRQTDTVRHLIKILSTK